MFSYFTLALNINCSRKQQKLDIKQGLQSLRLDCSLVCIAVWKVSIKSALKAGKSSKNFIACILVSGTN